MRSIIMYNRPIRQGSEKKRMAKNAVKPGMFSAFYETVAQIPKGSVMNYGTVAELAGFKGCSRRVGFALHQNPDPERVPCHRVVFKDGSLSSAFAFGGVNRQRELLEAEGVGFVGERVDMDKHCIKKQGNKK